jgi:EmrB/QacA subfamily drug resistance transporter
MVPGSLAIIGALFGPDTRGKAIGTWSAFSTMTTILGPLLGGYLAGIGLWRGVFLINIPLAVVALAALILKVPENRDESAARQIDLPGALLAVLGLGGLTVGFNEVSELGLSNPIVFGGFIIGVIGLAAFIWVESHSDHPMMPLGLFESRTFTGTNLLTLFLYGALYGLSFFLSLNLIQQQGYTALEAGLATLPFALALILLSRWAGGMVDRVGARPLLIIGPVVVGIGFLLMALPGLTKGPSDYWLTFFPGVLIWGIGMGIVVAPLTTAVMGAVSPNRAGVASGINNAVARTAGALAIAIMGAIGVFLFQQQIAARTAQVDLPSATAAEVQQQALKLGNASVPESVTDAQKNAVDNVIKQSFVNMFRWIAGIAAALAFISAGLAALFVEPKKASPEVSTPAAAPAA